MEGTCPAGPNANLSTHHPATVSPAQLEKLRRCLTEHLRSPFVRDLSGDAHEAIHRYVFGCDVPSAAGRVPGLFDAWSASPHERVGWTLKTKRLSRADACTVVAALEGDPHPDSLTITLDLLSMSATPQIWAMIEAHQDDPARIAAELATLIKAHTDEWLVKRQVANARIGVLLRSCDLSSWAYVEAPLPSLCGLRWAWRERGLHGYDAAGQERVAWFPRNGQVKAGLTVPWADLSLFRL